MFQRKESQKPDLLNGPLPKKIFLFAVPIAASSILQQLFNSADVAVVGHFSGSDALAAVGANTPVIAMFVNILVGLSVGVNVSIAQYIGQKKIEKVNRAVHTSILFALIIGIITALIGQFIAEDVLLMIGTPQEILSKATLYLKIYFWGMPIFTVYNFSAAILRSVGDTKRPMYCLLISGFINLILNLIFVIYLHMDVAGVALATIIANLISDAIIIKLLMNEEEMIRFMPPKMAIDKEELIKIIRIGGPASLQTLVFTVSNVCIQAGINSFGSKAIAGSSTGLCFEYIDYFLLVAFNNAAITFTGQNYGAKQFDRCKKIFQLSIAEAFASVFILSELFIFFRYPLIGIFSSDPEVITFASERMLRIITFQSIAVSYEITGSVLRGMGCSMLPAVLTIIGSVAFRILWLSTIFQKIHTYQMLMDVYIVSWIITGIMVVSAYFIIRKKLFSKAQKAGA